jgi:cell division protein ZapE
MSLTNLYDEAVARGDIDDDVLQRQVLVSLELLTEKLTASKRAWFSWGRKKTIQGVYILGPVGVGKTFLMDLFYDQVPIQEKKRFHFHHFMQQVDARLRVLQGVKNPLQRIADEVAHSTKLLCFDEFMVDDVAYAMILSELLQGIFNRGVTLVATSNTRPDDLYLKGVQRARFLPAIAAIKKHCDVINLGDKRDYRLGRALEINTYLTPLGTDTSELFSRQFDLLAPQATTQDGLIVQNREISFIKRTDRIVWFDFKVICNLPRSQLDYLEIANRFDTVFVSEIPVMGEKDTIFAILLIRFVDVMYDRGIKLILSAAAPIEELYPQGEMSHAFKRTSSRLQEMQSIGYLQRHPHRVDEDLSHLN